MMLRDARGRILKTAFTVTAHYCPDCQEAAELATREGEHGRRVGHLVDAAAPDRGWFLLQILSTDGYAVPEHSCVGDDCDCLAEHYCEPEAAPTPLHGDPLLPRGRRGRRRLRLGRFVLEVA